MVNQMYDLAIGILGGILAPALTLIVKIFVGAVDKKKIKEELKNNATIFIALFTVGLISSPFIFKNVKSEIEINRAIDGKTMVENGRNDNKSEKVTNPATNLNIIFSEWYQIDSQQCDREDLARVIADTSEYTFCAISGVKSYVHGNVAGALGCEIKVSDDKTKWVLNMLPVDSDCGTRNGFRRTECRALCLKAPS